MILWLRVFDELWRMAQAWAVVVTFLGLMWLAARFVQTLFGSSLDDEHVKLNDERRWQWIRHERSAPPWR